MTRISIAVVFAVILLSACCTGRKTEYLSRQIESSGTKYGYRVYVPRNRENGKKTPVMLYLHGSNRRGDDNESQIEDLDEIVRAHPEYFPYIIVYPQCRTETFWSGPMMEQALAALDQTVEEFNGDKDRLYLAGYSMGGFGVWQTAITYPGKFAAIVPIAGGVEPVGEISDKDRSILSPQVAAAAASGDTYKAYAAALARTPVWIVHGSEDKVVPVAGSRKMFSSLRAVGNPAVVYKELEGVGHGSVNNAFSDPELVKWLSERHK